MTPTQEILALYHKLGLDDPDQHRARMEAWNRHPDQTRKRGPALQALSLDRGTGKTTYRAVELMRELRQDTTTYYEIVAAPPANELDVEDDDSVVRRCVEHTHQLARELGLDARRIVAFDEARRRRPEPTVWRMR